MSENDCADCKHLEFSAEVGDDGDEGPDGAECEQQDGAECDTNDGQGTSVEIGGDEFRDADEWATVMEEPVTNGVVPSLDGSSSVPADHHESEDDCDTKDGDRNRNKNLDGLGGSPGLANCFRRARSGQFSVVNSSSNESIFIRSLGQGRAGDTD